MPECALLAGIIRAPTSSSPRVDPEKAKLRRNATLKQMLEEGYIKREDYSGYVEAPVRIQPAKPSGLQTYVMAAAVKEMEQILSIEGTEEMPQGLTVRTNIDMHLQRVVESEMNSQLAELEKPPRLPPPRRHRGTAAPRPRPADLQGAAIVADLSTGRIKAWVGGRDFSRTSTTTSRWPSRENGALLQPLLYALAFDRLDLHPASMINASYIDTTSSAAQADLALGNPMVDLTKWFLSIQDALALGNRSAATRVGLQLHARAVTTGSARRGSSRPASRTTSERFQSRSDDAWRCRLALPDSRQRRRSPQT